MARTAKPRIYHGNLANLMRFARERLHAWFCEENETVPYKEIQRRMKAEFGMDVSITSLSNYYHKRFLPSQQVPAPSSSSETVTPTTQAIVIRIDVPPGCSIEVSTEPGRDGTDA